MSTSETATRTRKPKARQKDIVLGCIEERLGILAVMGQRDVGNQELALHVSRIQELLDELKRSLGKDDE